ncbi:hypothetical protein PhCBS80983_g04425 [Powellomyces hirtus]|uniref:C2H2-type domain-containing protein n=1 Tax=Powellomyces hirtus TaxID=109895 RepID=A0A507DYI7_9FUNG|nr:hypothetical protein PhCBS80983_g04425 [Powellomyces hirtus]
MVMEHPYQPHLFNNAPLTRPLTQQQPGRLRPPPTPSLPSPPSSIHAPAPPSGSQHDEELACWSPVDTTHEINPRFHAQSSVPASALYPHQNRDDFYPHPDQRFVSLGPTGGGPASNTPALLQPPQQSHMQMDRQASTFRNDNAFVEQEQWTYQDALPYRSSSGSQQEALPYQSSSGSQQEALPYQSSSGTHQDAFSYFIPSANNTVTYAPIVEVQDPVPPPRFSPQVPHGLSALITSFPASPMPPEYGSPYAPPGAPTSSSNSNSIRMINDNAGSLSAVDQRWLPYVGSSPYPVDSTMPDTFAQPDTAMPAWGEQPLYVSDPRQVLGPGQHDQQHQQYQQQQHHPQLHQPYDLKPIKMEPATTFVFPNVPAPMLSPGLSASSSSRSIPIPPSPPILRRRPSALTGPPRRHSAAGGIKRSASDVNPSASSSGSSSSKLTKHQPASKKGKAVATNSGEDVLRCPFPNCDKTFGLTCIKLLVSHLTVHSSLRPYTCESPTCDKSFARQHDAFRHYRSMHEKPSFECPFCKARFSRKDTLKDHVAMAMTRPCPVRRDRTAAKRDRAASLPPKAEE